MISFVVLAVSLILATTYALLSSRGEERRQEWRRHSRAAWVKN